MLKWDMKKIMKEFNVNYYYAKKLIKEKNLDFNEYCKEHCVCKTRLYMIWNVGMKSRCYNPNQPSYKWYGAKGIKICDEWLDFENFQEWSLNNGYTDELTINRKDSTGDYEPNNCEWIPMSEQGKDRSNNKNITINGITYHYKKWKRIAANLGIKDFNKRLEHNVPDEFILDPNYLINKYQATLDGETKTLSEWSSIKGLNINTLIMRFDKGYRDEEIFNYKTNKKWELTIDGETKMVSEWAKEKGINYLTLKQRIQLNVPVDKLFIKGDLRYSDNKVEKDG